jgi:hypothetical protein
MIFIAVIVIGRSSAVSGRVMHEWLRSREADFWHDRGFIDKTRLDFRTNWESQKPRPVLRVRTGPIKFLLDYFGPSKQRVIAPEHPDPAVFRRV